MAEVEILRDLGWGSSRLEVLLLYEKPEPEVLISKLSTNQNGPNFKSLIATLVGHLVRLG